MQSHTPRDKSWEAASQHHAAVRAAVESAVRPWVEDAVIIEALELQNRRSAALSQAQVEDLDRIWQQEVAADHRPLIHSVLSTDLSHFLKRVRDESQGLLTEIFVMDLRGLNVGQSDLTSGYWHGNEPKWRHSCAAGPEAIFIDEVEEIESTWQFQAQVSLSIADSRSGQVIGCVTIGVDVDLAMDLGA